MSDKILTDYKSPVISAGIRDTLRSFMPPGRYHGFDEMVAGTTGANDIKLKIQHSEKIKLEDGVEYAALFAPQALLIYTTNTLEASIPKNNGSDYLCYVAYASVVLDTAIPENSSWSMLLNPSPITTSDYSTVNPADHLSNPDTQIAIGVVVAPPSATTIGDCIYVKYAQQPFGYDTPSSGSLAWRIEDNLFTGINNQTPKTSVLPTDMSGSVLELRGQNCIITGNSVVTISDFQRVTDIGVVSFDTGTIITILFSESGPIIDGDTYSNIYLPNESSLNVLVGTYQFIKAADGKWYMLSAFNHLFLDKISKKVVSWSNLSVPASGNITGGNFYYYPDSDGKIHLYGYASFDSAVTIVSDTKLTSLELPILFRPITDQRIYAETNDISHWNSTAKPCVFKISTDGFVYVMIGSNVTGDSYYLPEIIFTP